MQSSQSYNIDIAIYILQLKSQRVSDLPKRSQLLDVTGLELNLGLCHGLSILQIEKVQIYVFSLNVVFLLVKNLDRLQYESGNFCNSMVTANFWGNLILLFL